MDIKGIVIQHNLLKSTILIYDSFDSKPKVYEGKAPKPSDSVATGYGGTSYLTEHKASFKDRNPADGKIPIDIATKCKVDHFQIGGNG